MYLPALAAHPAAQVVAVCGRRSEPAASFASQWGIAQWFVDPVAMLNEVQLDAVIIATANDSHFELAMAALDRGLHVLCEKPLALNADQAAAMAERAHTSGAITMVPFTYHYMPMNRWVRQLVADGYVGRPLHINLRYYTSYAFDTAYSWRFDREIAGSGIIGDLGPHWVHLARWLLNDTETQVSALSSRSVERDLRPDGNDYERLEDSAVLTVRYASGAYGVLQVSAVCWEGTPFGQTHHLEIHGDAGTIYATCDWDMVQEVRGLCAGDSGGAQVLPIPDDIWNGVRRDTVHNTYRDLFRNTDAMTRGWIDAIVASRPIEPSFIEGLAVQRVTDAAFRSSLAGGVPELLGASGHARSYGDVHILAIDHRWQLEEMASLAGADPSRIAPLKLLFYQGFNRVAASRSDVGLLLDDQYSRAVLDDMAGRGLWVFRAFDVPLSRPVEFMSGVQVEQALQSWPEDHIAKLMVYAHPDDPAEMADVQWLRMKQYSVAARAAKRRCLIEFQSPAGVPPGTDYLAKMLSAAYDRDIAPDWWKLPPLNDAQQWADAAGVIAANDPSCEGMLVLGQTAQPAALAAGLAAAASEPMVRGFAIGRAIFGDVAARWLRGEADDAAVIDEVAANFAMTVEVWGAARR